VKQGDPQANAPLEWEFSFEVEWGETIIGAGVGGISSGTMKITDKLNKKKYVDSDSLADYKVRLDASLKEKDWDLAQSEGEDPSEWNKLFGEGGG